MVAPKPGTALAWAHNQGVGRNLLLTRALNEACASADIPLLMHHHDWWFDNRWPRWPEMRRSGFRTLSAVARTLFPPLATVRHAAINQAEAAILQRYLGRTAGWIPNPADPSPKISAPRRRWARGWLDRSLGERAPVWLVPCRLLRRKNLAEALLLTRWLRPEAWLVTTGGVSSAAETAYGQTLETAARKEGWRMRLGVLSGGDPQPSVAELLAVSEVILLTSVQEGFGLPYVEAAAAGRPLLARSLENVAPDLLKAGLHLPQLYEELMIDPGLLDWPAEQHRQRQRFRRWLAALPESCRRQVLPPPMLIASAPIGAIPFSRLTLTAQLEILRQPVGHSWARCAPLNPFLEPWRHAAASGQFKAAGWTRQTEQALGGDGFGRRLADLVRQTPDPARIPHAWRCHEHLLRSKLRPVFLYPLLWSSEA